MAKIDEFKAKIFELAKENNQDPETVWANCEVIEAMPGEAHAPTFFIYGQEGNFLERDAFIAFGELFLR